MRRDYAGIADLHAVERFAQRVWSLHSRWHLGDLAWGLGHTPEARPDEPMALWEIDGEVAAWGCLTLPDDLALLVDPARPELIDDVLHWAGATATAPLTITVLDTEKHLVDALEQHGYLPDLDGPFFLAHNRDLIDLPPVPDLPDGLIVRAVRGEADLVQRARVHQEVWQPLWQESAEDERRSRALERFRVLMRQWPYRPDFDFIVETAGGRFVASCLGWYDEVNRVGELEPVGTVAEFRRQGLSRAATIGVLRAFRDAGGEKAIVYARGDDDYPIPKQVYAALGFTPHARTVRYHLAG